MYDTYEAESEDIMFRRLSSLEVLFARLLNRQGYGVPEGGFPKRGKEALNYPPLAPTTPLLPFVLEYLLFSLVGFKRNLSLYWKFVYFVPGVSTKWKFRDSIIRRLWEFIRLSVRVAKAETPGSQMFSTGS